MHPVTRNICCKMCEKVLLGQIGAAQVSESYVSFKGSISLQMKNPENGYRYWVTILNEPDRFTAFCDLVCVQDYFDFREKAREEERLARKREMNREEWSRGGGNFTR